MLFIYREDGDKPKFGEAYFRTSQMYMVTSGSRLTLVQKEMRSSIRLAPVGLQLVLETSNAGHTASMLKVGV